jgi:pimeloyl-ACP methyl ester carboxylesterase
MGGFVCAELAARYPQRVGATVLVDGGLPLVEKMPEGISLEDFVRKILGPAMQRLEMQFPTPQAYRDYWRVHPSLAPSWSEWVEHYVDYDLQGSPPSLRSSVNPDAVLGDARTILDGPSVKQNLHAMQGPVRFVRAPRGMLDDAPLYAEALMPAWAAQIRGFQAVDAPDTNHYTILLARHGAAVVAEQVRELVGAGAGAAAAL